ncbi:SDR family oxidoreductase [Novosphingobium sp. G106]|uniref:SDR family oxidoreductase n=1 Tax=Novosphingobium sp. G106 TaxID=2849500 RepID=UPI001C2D5BA4|nr:SDR family oxidoreductase [Novosphingobium sp. G106]MBV1688872.1 SDR family oxidoreductase [Novosphingobium sp. G106]
MSGARTILITGAAAGINAATADHLRGLGHRVIGVDLRDADIIADLATPDGRAAMVEQAKALAPGGLDGIVAGAGVSRPDQPGLAVQVNYFGAVATLEGLHPLLSISRSPRAVAVVSTASLLPASAGTVSACLAGDEHRAIAAAQAHPATAYAASKKALAQWLRRNAVTPRWAGSGVALNGVAPGGVHTAMMAEIDRDPKFQAMMTNTTPKAVASYAQPQDLGEVIGWLVTSKTSYLLGQIIFVDGGSDAILRPDTF